MAPRSATPRTCRRPRTCSAAGRRSTSSRRRWKSAGYQGPADRAKLVEATEALTAFEEGKEHPQGDKTFNGKLHQAYGHQNISKVEGGKLKVVHRTAIEDGLYEPEGDYTTQPL